MDFKKYKLKDLIENFSVRAKDYGGSEGLEFLGVSNEDGIVKSKYAAEGKAEEYKIIEKGCFAYNPYRINVGSIAYLNEDIRGLISPAYVVFKTKENTIKDNLLFKFLKSAEGLRQIKFHGRGTVRQALRFEDLCKIEIAIPNYEEQEILISNIENTEFESNLISTELTHQLDLIKQLRQAFLREALQGKLVRSSELGVDSETGHDLLAKIKAEKAQLIAEKKLKKEKELPSITSDEIPFEILEHWAWCRLGEIGICKTGTTPSTTNKDFYGSDIPFIKPADITLKGLITNNEGLSMLGLNEGVEIPENSLMMVCIGGSIGKSYYNKIRVSCNQQINTITPLAKINAVFLQFWLQSNYFQKEIWSKASGGTTPIVNRTKWESIFIPLPPLHDQEQIVAKLEELMAFCDGLEQSIKESQGYNEKLLQQVLREALQG